MFSQASNLSRTLIAAACLGLLFGLDMSQPLHAQQPDPATQLYVSNIRVSWIRETGSQPRSVAMVDIVDGNGKPVNGALVIGDWSGCFKLLNVSDATETVCSIPGFIPYDTCVEGEAVIWGKRHSCRSTNCLFTFTITGVQLDGKTYVPVQGKTSGFISCTTF